MKKAYKPCPSCNGTGRVETASQPTPADLVMKAINHEATYTRRSRGFTAVAPRRPLYGWTVRCVCEWHAKINGPKREAERLFKAHRRGSIRT